MLLLLGPLQITHDQVDQGLAFCGLLAMDCKTTIAEAFLAFTKLACCPRLPQIAQTVRPSAARLQARAPAAAQEVGAIRTAAAVKLSVTAFTDIASFSLGEKTIGTNTGAF